MNSGILSSWPWLHFIEFISPEVDRFSILKRILQEALLNYTVITISGNRHFFISPPPPEGVYLRRRLTILVAHYDRYPGSPGANDNSAAVFILLETALKLRKEKVNNWLIIFTDKEELFSGESIRNQGSYSLAAGLRETGMDRARIYSFDACGTGDSMIVSDTADYLLKNERGGEKIRSSLKDLRENALAKGRTLSMAKIHQAPSPFSDDLGFLRAGLAAQTITMLPSEECATLVSIVRRDPGFAEVLVNQKMRNSQNVMQIPGTWRNLNSNSDSYLKLTPQHFRIVQRFAEALCK